MIPQTQTLKAKHDWQRALACTINSAEELLSRLGLSGQLQGLSADAVRQFPVKVPESYVKKMRYGDPHDPLLRQVFPLLHEAEAVSGYLLDPVGDNLAVTSPGILQKYHGRALLVTTGICAIHCRYCFRRHFPYSDSNPLASQWPQTQQQLAADNSITEVILSGGDPLILSNKIIGRLLDDLASIPHIKRLRIHTRLPVVLPERIDKALVDNLSTTRLKVVVVIHANHANEIDSIAANALHKLKIAGCQLLNQTVLLKGINDNVEALSALSERLNDVDVMPYYLHLLDKVAGAHHFDQTESTAIELIDALRTRLPGYLVPRLVREQQGKASKTIIR